MRIGFTGDWMFGDQPLLLGMGMASRWRGKYHEVLKGFSDHLDSHPMDALVVNLECVLSPEEEPRELQAMQVSHDVIPVLREIGVTAVSLANNHTMEYGPEAFDLTARVLADAGIHTFGHADDPIIQLAVKNAKIGLLGFSMIPATYGHVPRYFYLDPNHSESCRLLRKHLSRARTSCDLVVAYPHWGAEFMDSPSNQQVRTAELLIESGVNLIVGAHPHVIQPAWELSGVPVYFSLGNMVTDYPIDRVRRNAYVAVSWDPGRGISTAATIFSTDKEYRVVPTNDTLAVTHTHPPTDDETYRKESVRQRNAVRNQMLLYLASRFPRVLTNWRLLRWIVRRGWFLLRRRRELRENRDMIYSGPMH